MSISILFARDTFKALLASETRAKGSANVSWEATEAVLQLFPRKTKRAQFDAMIVIAHHYNNDGQHSFPGLELIQQKVGCKKRYAIKLLDALRNEKDIYLIEKGRDR